MGITCKPLGVLKKELKKIDVERIKEKTEMNRSGSKNK